MTEGVGGGEIHQCPHCPSGILAQGGDFTWILGEKSCIISQQRNELSSILILFAIQMNHRHSLISRWFPLSSGISQRPPDLQPRTDSVWGRTGWGVTNTDISSIRHLGMSSEVWSWHLDSGRTVLGDWAPCPGCFPFRRGQFQGSNSDSHPRGMYLMTKDWKSFTLAYCFFNILFLIGSWGNPFFFFLFNLSLI